MPSLTKSDLHMYKTDHKNTVIREMNLRKMFDSNNMPHLNYKSFQNKP